MRIHFIIPFQYISYFSSILLYTSILIVLYFPIVIFLVYLWRFLIITMYKFYGNPKKIAEVSHKSFRDCFTSSFLFSFSFTSRQCVHFFFLPPLIQKKYICNGFLNKKKWARLSLSLLFSSCLFPFRKEISRSLQKRDEDSCSVRI